MKTRFFDHYKRSIAKTITYRIIILLASYVVFMFLTRDELKAVSLSVGWNAFGIVAYFVHERIWNKIHWGKTSAKRP